jgi:hypothetical protein
LPTARNDLAGLISEEGYVEHYRAIIAADAIIAAGWRRIPPNWQGCPERDPWFGELCVWVCGRWRR